MPAPDDLTAILAAARDGDREALGRLWQRHRRFVAAVLLAHGDAADLDDLLQEVALRMTRALAGLASAASLRPWLRTLARNVAIDHGRRRRERQDDGPQLRALPRCDDDPHVPVEPWFDARVTARHRDELDAVLHALGALDPDHREPLLLRAVEGLSQREIATALDLPETTVETRLARARRLLRERHQREHIDTEGARDDAPSRGTLDQPRHRPAR